MKLQSLFVLYCVLAGTTLVSGQRVGLINKLYEAHAEVQIASELQLTPDQVARLAAYDAKFRAENADFIRTVTAMNRRKSQDGNVPWEAHRETVQKLNREMMNNTKAVLADRAQFRRYVQLLTQKYLREERFEEAAALHGFKMNLDVRRTMQARAADLGATRGQRLAQESWPRLSKVLTVLIAEARINESAGALIEVLDLPKTAATDPLEFYDDLIMRLALNPTVQLDLTLTAEQSQAVAAFYERTQREQRVETLNERYEAAFASGEAALAKVAENEIYQDIIKLNQDLRDGIRGVLTDPQRQRLDQLLFQQYVRDTEFQKALMLAGVAEHTFDRFDSENQETLRELSYASRDAKMYLRYWLQFDRLIAGIEVFDILAGKDATWKLIGDIVLAPEDPLMPEDPLRAELTETFQRQVQDERPTLNLNPRRASRAR